MRGSAPAAFAAAIGVALAVGACSSGSTSAPPTHLALPSESTPLPPGYERVGGPAQGVSIAGPSSWVWINFAQMNAAQALRKIALPGRSQSQTSALVQSLRQWQQVKAIFGTDRAPHATSQDHESSIAAWCASSGTTQWGSAGLPSLRQPFASTIQSDGGQNIKETDEEIGGVPGLRVAYTETKPPIVGTAHEVALVVLPRPGRYCDIVVGVVEPFTDPLFNTVASSVQFYP